MPRGAVKKFKPFWNSELANLKKYRDEKRRALEQHGTRGNNSALREAQAKLQRKIIDSKTKSLSNFLSRLNYKEDGAKAHRFVSNLNNDGKEKRNEPLQIKGKEIAGNKEKSCALAKYYASVGRLLHSKIKYEATPLPFPLTKEEFEIMDKPFDKIELERALGESKKGKCAGPDDIPSELLINLGAGAKDTFLDVCNMTWKLGVPAEWRKATIVPILKKDKPASNPSSYRPIALTNTSCKIMERMISNRLTRYAEIKSLISDRQAGFRRKRNTVEQVAYLAQWVKDAFNRKQSTGAVFIDFKAAYDTICRKLLINKIKKLGFKGHMFDWIRSFLSQRFARVTYSCTTSPYVEMRNGLPQGAVLSCSLFNMMVNDLIDVIEQDAGVQCLLYADDLVIFASSSNVEAIERALRHSMTRLHKWCAENFMTVNTAKTVTQLYTLSTKNHQLNVMYDGHLIKQESSVKYLGVTLDNKLLWRQHAETIAKSAELRLRLMQRLAGTKWGASEDILKTTYKSYVRPVLEYGAELIAGAPKSTQAVVDKVQNKAMRLITGGAVSAPIAAMEAQTGLESLETRREANAMKLAERCLRLPVKHWTNHNTATQRLTTQEPFLGTAQRLRSAYDLKLDSRALIRTSGKLSPVMTPPIRFSIHLDSRKSDTPAAILHSSSLEAINNLYPALQWIRVFTDGSASTARHATGAGFYSKDLIEGSIAVGKGTSNFDGEVIAVKEAAKDLLRRGIANSHIVFFVDSQAAIKALGTMATSDNYMVEDAKEAIAALMEANSEVVYEWVPSHCGLAGNEKADQLAKLGCDLPQPEPPLTLNAAASLIRAKVSAKYQDALKASAVGKSWQSLLCHRLPSNLPRRVFVANFRLLTGHDYLQAHLHRIGLAESPNCPLCNLAQPMNFDHLYSCPSLADDVATLTLQNLDRFYIYSHLYWAARTKMDEIPNGGVR